MTLHPRKQTWTPPVLRQESRAKPARPTRPNAPPLTLGHVLGDAWAEKQRRDARAAELADMGFKPLGGA